MLSLYTLCSPGKHSHRPVRLQPTALTIRPKLGLKSAYPISGNIVVKIKLPLRSGSSLEAVKPHP